MVVIVNASVFQCHLQPILSTTNPPTPHVLFTQLGVLGGTREKLGVMSVVGSPIYIECTVMK